MKQSDNKGMISTFIGAIFWGAGGTLGSYLFMNKNITSDWLVPYRLILAGVFMLIYLYKKDKKFMFSIWKNKKDVIDLFIFGIFGMLGTQYTYFTTVQYSNAGIATVLQYLGPTLILLYVCIIEKRIPKKYEISALILSILGVFILATHGNIGTLTVSFKALVWGLSSAVVMVIYTIQPVRIIKKYGTVLPVAWAMLVGGIILSFYTKPWLQSGEHDFITFLFLILIVFFATIMAFVLYLNGVATIGATKASMVACIEPVAATILSILFLGTIFTFLDFLGFICIMSTIFIIAYYGSKK